MGNFRAYPGMWLVATEDQKPGIEKGKRYQLLNVGGGCLPMGIFTFVGVLGTYPKTGKGWEPVYSNLDFNADIKGEK